MGPIPPRMGMLHHMQQPSSVLHTFRNLKFELDAFFEQFCMVLDAFSAKIGSKASYTGKKCMPFEISRVAKLDYNGNNVKDP